MTPTGFLCQPAAGRAIPLASCTGAQIDTISHRLLAAWQGWLVAWQPGGADSASLARCEVRHAHDHQQIHAPSWRTIGWASDASAWLACGADPVDAIGRILFDSAPSGLGSLGLAVARDALDALLNALRESLRLDAPKESRGPDAALLRAWSGALVATMDAGTTSPLSILVNHEAVLAVSGTAPRDAGAPAHAPPPLAQIAHALAPLHVRLDAQIHGCVLDLGTLQSLRIGDVVLLNHQLDVPLQLQHAAQPVAAGYLGTLSGSKALQLAPLRTSTHEPS